MSRVVHNVMNKNVYVVILITFCRIIDVLNNVLEVILMSLELLEVTGVVNVRVHVLYVHHWMIVMSVRMVTSWISWMGVRNVKRVVIV